MKAKIEKGGLGEPSYKVRRPFALILMRCGAHRKRNVLSHSF